MTLKKPPIDPELENNGLFNVDEQSQNPIEIQPEPVECSFQIAKIVELARSVIASTVSSLIVFNFGYLMIAAGKLEQPKRNQIASWLQQHLWSIPTLKMMDIDLRVKGLENLKKDSAHILASNHQGILDGLAIPAALAQKSLGMCFIAKRQLLDIPIFGKAVESLGVPTIDRGNTAEAKESLERITDEISRNNLNVIWFPEGTRSEDGNLGPFKKGFAYMAIQSGAPVVPVCIKGSHESMPKGSLLAKPGVISVTFGEPIDTTGMSVSNKDDINGLVQKTEEEISGMLIPVS